MCSVAVTRCKDQNEKIEPWWRLELAPGQESPGLKPERQRESTARHFQPPIQNHSAKTVTEAKDFLALTMDMPVLFDGPYFLELVMLFFYQWVG